MHFVSRSRLTLLAPAAVAALATLVTGSGCSRRVRVEEPYVAGAPSSLAPSTVMFAQAVQVDVVRAGVSRALVERHFQPESEEGTRVYARFTHRRGSVRIAVDYTATQAVITPIESTDVDEREWASWVRALSSRMEEEVNRPGQEAAVAARQQQEQAQAQANTEAQRQANERMERERMATQREQARAQAASAEANAREQARLDRQARADQVRLEREQRIESERLERERRREEARQRRLGVYVEQPQQPQIVVVAPQLQIGVQPQQPVQQQPVQQPQVGLSLNRGQANFGAHNVYGTNLPTPYAISVISGGNLEARLQGIPGNCRGFVTAQPDVIINYAQPSRRLGFFVDGQGDTTLVIRAPNGQWWCSDDEGGGQNPLVDIQNPQGGQYEIWVGSFRAGDQLRGNFQVYDPNMLAQQQQQQAQVVQVQPAPPNCRALAMSTGNAAYASSCTDDTDPYCAEAVFQSGNPAYITSCRGVDRACAVAAARAGHAAYISSCTGNIDSQCAVAAINAGTPAYISSCRR